MLAAGTESQSESGLVYHKYRYRKKKQNNRRCKEKILKKERLKKSRVLTGCKSEYALGNTDPCRYDDCCLSLTLDSPCQNDGKCRCKHIEGRTADGLIRFEADGCQCKKQRKNQSGQTGNQYGEEHGQKRIRCSPS